MQIVCKNFLLVHAASCLPDFSCAAYRQAADGDGGVYPDKCNALVHAAYDHLVSVLDKPKG